MNILQRYIAKTMVFSTAAVSFIILAILLIMALMMEAKSIGDGDYGLGQAILYVLYRMPNEIYHFSPLLVLLGSIMGLSMLSTYRELAVMRSSGFSIFNIIKSVLLAALLLILLVSAIGESIGPNLSYKAVIHKENAKNAGEAVVTSSGIWWFHIGNNFIHVQQVVDRKLLDGVTRYQFDDNYRLQAAYFAKTLSLENNQWMMKNIVKTSFYNDRTKSEYIAKAPLDLKFNTNLLNVDLLDPSEMSLSKLTAYSHYLKKNGLQANEYQFNFWQRIFQPLACLVMIFLAIPFVLSAFSMSSLGLRMMIGIVTGFSFFILNGMLGQLCIVYQIPAFFAALLPIILFAVLGVFLSRRLIRQ